MTDRLEEIKHEHAGFVRSWAGDMREEHVATCDECWLIAEIERARVMIDALLIHCPDAECGTCGMAVCPHDEPLHFHHDGCPACHVAEMKR